MAMSIDPYKILGVSRSSTQDEIKKAYRKLALKWHPDRNQDDPESEERFKEISAAHQAIGTSSARKEYDDERLHRTPNQSRDSESPGFNDIFNNINANFGNPGRHNWEDLFGSTSTTSRRRPVVIKAHVDVTLEELSSGQERIFMMDGQTVRFKIPIGSRGGMTVVIPLSAGQELHAMLKMKDHPTFKVSGDDLYAVTAVPISTAVKGGDLEVPTLHGSIRLKVSPFTNSHTKMRVKGYGLPRHDGLRGAIIYELKITCDDLTDSQRDIIRDVL